MLTATVGEVNCPCHFPREYSHGYTGLMMAALEGDEIIVDILIACVSEGERGGGREGVREGRREGGREGRREGGWEEGREGGREERRESGREERREGGKEGRREQRRRSE